MEPGSSMEAHFWKATHVMFLFETGHHSVAASAQCLASYEDVEGKVSEQPRSRVLQTSKFEPEGLQKHERLTARGTAQLTACPSQLMWAF